MIETWKAGTYSDFTLDIEVYKYFGDGYWAQAMFLVHGLDDVLWTNDVDAALNYLRTDIDRIKNGEVQ